MESSTVCCCSAGALPWQPTKTW